MALPDKVQSVAKSLVGGNIVTILLRQAILRQSIRRGPQAGQGLYVENPMPFIAGIPITTRMQEAYTYQADVTKHSIESGGILSDHVIIQPTRIDLSFDISNWESGFAEYSFDLLEKLFLSRTPVELLTEHKRLPNMIMTSFQADNSVPTWGKLGSRASFTQLKFITLETVKYPATKVDPTDNTSGPATPKSAESAVDNGQQKPRVSVAKGLVGNSLKSLFGG